MAGELVELSQIGKSFGSTRALDGVSFAVRPGEVHVLCGENGAGKSTLIRILCGAITEFDGELRVAGEGRRFSSPAHALRAGIAAIHQELSLIGSMSVADNLALGSGDRAWAARSPARDRARAIERLGELGLELDPDRKLESLPLSVQQELEIARALMRGARVIVMDEPTSALGETEAERLMTRIGELVERGAGVVYISHRMEEIFRVADRVTVLRDGKCVLTVPAAELDRERLVSAMVGRSLSDVAVRAPPAKSEPVLELGALTLADPARPARRLLSDVSLSLCRGEIVGLAGVAGCGASELLHALFGSFGRVDATVTLCARRFVPESPMRSLDAGLVLLGNDRRLSLVGDLTVSDNTTLSSLARFTRFGVVEREAERRAAREVLERLAVRGSNRLGDPVRQLSGGNQQKVALARCLLAEPRVLLLDEPTRGIDIGAKNDVYRFIRALAEQGVGILLVASELEELLLLSHRVLVLHRGRIVDELSGSSMVRERIVASAMGASAA